MFPAKNYNSSIQYQEEKKIDPIYFPDRDANRSKTQLLLITPWAPSLLGTERDNDLAV